MDTFDMNSKDTTFLRTRDTLAMRGISKSQHYVEISEGLWTKPVKVGKRGSAWPLAEIEIQQAARLAGLSTLKIRKLVRKLEKKRQEQFDSL